MSPRWIREATLGESGLMDSSVVMMMRGVRRFFRFAYIDGLTGFRVDGPI